MSFPHVAAVASRNPDKIREILAICSDWPVQWRTAQDHPGQWPDVEETGTTYLDNARLKASAVAGALVVPALADDSGIEVDSLGGAPGPRSARASPSRMRWNRCPITPSSVRVSPGECSAVDAAASRAASCSGVHVENTVTFRSTSGSTSAMARES